MPVPPPARLDGEGGVVLDPSATRGTPAVDPVRPVEERLAAQKHRSRAEEVVVPDGIGGHGGGDAPLLMDVFRRDLRLRADPPGRPAGHPDGVRAVAVGVAANRSMPSGQPVLVEDPEPGVPPEEAPATGAGAMGT
ncbi:hypothetical protein SUDANB58_00392 [Streptomyces sp. enrichment culture]|uniref:hypothetical protein n=1 Tax=Streptomyces sp. enrichment culture TaxID=1795815 RepID=UPI003F547489